MGLKGATDPTSESRSHALANTVSGRGIAIEGFIHCSQEEESNWLTIELPVANLTQIIALFRAHVKSSKKARIQTE